MEPWRGFCFGVVCFLKTFIKSHHLLQYILHLDSERWLYFAYIINLIDVIYITVLCLLMLFLWSKRPHIAWLFVYWQTRFWKKRDCVIWECRIFPSMCSRHNQAGFVCSHLRVSSYTGKPNAAVRSSGCDTALRGGVRLGFQRRPSAPAPHACKEGRRDRGSKPTGGFALQEAIPHGSTYPAPRKTSEMRRRHSETVPLFTWLCTSKRSLCL